MIDFNQTWSHQPLTLPQPVIQPAWGQRHVGVTEVKKVISLKTLLLLHMTGYGHVTHVHASAWPLLQKLWVWKFTQGHLGSHGSKGYFHQKCYFSYRLHGMAMWLMHIHQLESYGYKNWPWGHLGSQGSKGHFHQNAITPLCYMAWPLDSYMLINLRPSAYVMGSNFNLGSFGVTGVKRLFSLKCYNSSMLHSMSIRHSCIRIS